MTIQSSAPFCATGAIDSHILIEARCIIVITIPSGFDPYYVPPDKFLKPNDASHEVERLLHYMPAWERTQQALRASEDRLRLVIDTVPALIHSARADGYLDFFNQRWLDYVGLSMEEMSGWGWTAAVHPEDVATMVKKWRAAVAIREPFEREARLRRADGEYR